ncbi:MAG: hypothetical protein ACO1OB_29235, partial [Archangium sp.]
MQNRADRLRVLALLGVSLVLHAVFFWWFANSEAQRPPSYFSRPIVLEDVAWIDAKQPEEPQATPQPQQPVVKNTQPSKKQPTST